jgi:NADPH:quinone reductase-like Zn-dependent oxidoreductase
MKAVVWADYGPPDVLQLKEVETPTPRDNEVLIRIYATTATAGDCEQRSLKLPIWYALPMRVYVGFKRPERVTLLGMDLAGEIESVGKDVRSFREGDQVFGSAGVGFGAKAEYICLPEEPEAGALAIKPANMTYEEAAAFLLGELMHCVFLDKEISRADRRS